MLILKPGIFLVAAVGRRFEIGVKGDLPWRIPSDLALFKRLTLNKIVVMGRKTMESLPGKRPLPQRENLVLTSGEAPEGFVKTTVEGVMALSRRQPVMVIGGEQVYRTFLPIADGLLLNHIEVNVDGADAFFPAFNEDRWEQHEIQRHHDEKAGIDWRFCAYAPRNVSHR